MNMSHDTTITTFLLFLNIEDLMTENDGRNLQTAILGLSLIPKKRVKVRDLTLLHTILYYNWINSFPTRKILSKCLWGQSRVI